MYQCIRYNLVFFYYLIAQNNSMELEKNLEHFAHRWMWNIFVFFGQFFFSCSSHLC